jgi:hypothetical protein
MSDKYRPTSEKDPVATTSLGLLLVHLLWVFAGPFALAALLFGIMNSGNGWLTGRDLGLLIVVVLMIGARWVDQRSGHAIRVDGQPATWKDFRRYALTLPILACAAWIVANVVGNYW